MYSCWWRWGCVATLPWHSDIQRIWEIVVIATVTAGQYFLQFLYCFSRPLGSFPLAVFSFFSIHFGGMSRSCSCHSGYILSTWWWLSITVSQSASIIVRSSFPECYLSKMRFLWVEILSDLISEASAVWCNWLKASTALSRIYHCRYQVRCPTRGKMENSNKIPILEIQACGPSWRPLWLCDTLR